MRRQIQAVLFDFGGTLDADGVAWKERFHAFYRATGLEIAADAFQPHFFAADSSLVGRLPAGTDLSGTVDALVANLEVELASRSGSGESGDANGRGKRVASRFLSEASAAFARNRPVLRALGQHYRLGVISNFYGNLEAVCRGAGLASLFSALVDSHCVGAQKPDPAIFHAALGMLGTAPETTLLVGDSLHRDGEGARRMGMRFVWMVPQLTDGPKGQGTMMPPVEHTVTKLRELMRILR